MAKNVTTTAKQSTVILMTFSKSWSDKCLKKPRTMFSVNVTDGANKVALVQLLIADKSAPEEYYMCN